MAGDTTTDKDIETVNENDKESEWVMIALAVFEQKGQPQETSFHLFLF